MVQVEGLERLLLEHPLFEGMADEHRDLIAGCAANAVFEAGRYVYRQGGPADRFYLIRHGSVALEVHVPGREPFIVETLREGDVLGWGWILPPFRLNFDARALQLMRAVSIDAACLRGKMDEDHELGYQLYRRFMPVIADRLAASRLQIVDMYGHPDDYVRT